MIFCRYWTRHYKIAYLRVVNTANRHRPKWRQPEAFLRGPRLSPLSRHRVPARMLATMHQRGSTQVAAATTGASLSSSGSANGSSSTTSQSRCQVGVS